MAIAPSPAVDGARGWLERLVAFDTTSCNSNLALIDSIEHWLTTLGVSSTRIRSADGHKANLLFSIGPQVTGGVVLSAHTDVVPIDGQTWSSDPWKLCERDGKLYGRGTADMKGFIAAGLSRVPAMLGADLKRPVHFALSYDEEVGLLGAPSLIEALTHQVPVPGLVVVGEPTGMHIVDRHKGIVGLRTTVLGHEAHSSQTQLGVSANMVAARLMARIVEISERLTRAAPADNGFVPPQTTVTVGLVQGGTAPNILAGKCEFIWDVRATSPGEARTIVDEVLAYAAELESSIKARFPACAITTEALSNVPALTGAADAAARAQVSRLGCHDECQTASFVTEAGLFELAGLPTVVCGPGWIAQAHQPDEYIDISQLTASERFMDRLIDELCQ